jgi:hypothetical protein
MIMIVPSAFFSQQVDHGALGYTEDLPGEVDIGIQTGPAFPEFDKGDLYGFFCQPG